MIAVITHSYVTKHTSHKLKTLLISLSARYSTSTSLKQFPKLGINKENIKREMKSTRIGRVGQLASCAALRKFESGWIHAQSGWEWPP